VFFTRIHGSIPEFSKDKILPALLNGRAHEGKEFSSLGRTKGKNFSLGRRDGERVHT